jgi:chloramphenicol 3-O-phosphotransferase
MGLPLTVKTTVALPLSLGWLLVLAAIGLWVLPKTAEAAALAAVDAVPVAEAAVSEGVLQEVNRAMRAIATKGRETNLIMDFNNISLKNNTI